MQLNKPDSATSLMELIRDLVPEDMEIMQGTVTSANPLSVQLMNDDKMDLNASVLCVPRHLTDYTTTVDISGGSITSTMTTEGQHDHGNGGGHDHDGGEHEGHEDDEDGNHSHSGGEHSHESDGDHSHQITNLSVTGATMTVHNGLKAGDVVYILCFKASKKYYILDREG